MKKIIAILLALAVVSMAFAQTVSVSNKLETKPTVTIDGGVHYWGFANNYFLRDEVVGEAVTADGRAKVKGRIRFDLQTLSPDEKSILSFKPRWSWNSNANAADGNRSSVAALLKPWDFLEIGIGNLDDVGYQFQTNWQNFSWEGWTEKYKYGYNTIPGIVGTWQNINGLIKDGIQVCYVGVPGLTVGFGLKSADADLATMIKKSVFDGAALGARYSTDLFTVGAKWAGNFGYVADNTGKGNGTTANDTDKAYQDHTIYACFGFNGLNEAKVGTSLHAGVGFYTEKASAIKNANTQTTAFLFDIGAGFNFRNGITDDLNVAVGYVKQGSETAKVLPFAVRNKIAYSASSDATFAFEFAYAQSSLKEKKSVAGTANSNAQQYALAAGTTATPTVNGGFGWLIAACPSFSWKMGAHSFSIGVDAVTLGDIVPHAKTGWEWAWTGLRGKEANITFPLSWTYTF